MIENAALPGEIVGEWKADAENVQKNEQGE